MQFPSDKKPRRWFLALYGLLSAVGFVVWIFRRMPQSERKKFWSKVTTALKRSHLTLLEYCIPHERNDYKPKMFHHGTVRKILVVVLLVKIVLVSTLFIMYPNPARLSADVQSEAYRLINAYRSEKNLPALTTNAYLERVAMAKGQDMLANNYFSHYGLDGKKPWEWIDTSMYDYTTMGENLAMDFLTAGSVIRAFQKSPAHDRNLVHEKYTEIGIAVLTGYLDGHETNLMVVYFANPVVTPAPQIAQQPVQPAQPVTTKPAPATTNTATNRPEATNQVLPATKPAVNTAPAQVNANVSLVFPLPVQQPATNMVKAAEPTPQPSSSAVQPGPEVLGQEMVAPRTVMAENLNGGVRFSQGSMLQRIIAWFDRFMLGILLAVVLLLIVNIVVKIRVQHASIITNAMILIVVISMMLYLNVHQAEAMGEAVRILSLLR